MVMTKKIFLGVLIVFALFTVQGVAAGEYYKLVDSWGAQGQGDGQFQAPIGVATDAVGNVYVSESDIFSSNPVSRIQKFDAEGNFMDSWSPDISDNYLMYGITGIAVGGPSGYNYVNIVAITPPSSVDNTRTMDYYVQIFDKDGDSKDVWGPYSSNIFDMNAGVQIPMDIAVDNNGDAYVTSMNLSMATLEVTSSVRKFAPDGTWSTLLESTPPSGGSQEVYFGIDVAPSGEYFYITKWDIDTGGRSLTSHIQKYRVGGNMPTEWEIHNIGDDRPDLAGGISVTSGGNIFIIDSPIPFTLGEPVYIQEYAADGSFLTLGEPFGTGAGQIENPLLGPLGSIPLGIATDPAGENVYVADASTYQILKFHKDIAAGTNLVVGETGPLWTRPGYAISYTIHYHNIGIENAEDVTLEDFLDSNVDEVQSSTPYIYDAQTHSMKWTIGTLRPGEQGMVNVLGVVPSSVPIGTDITNTVVISSSTIDTHSEDNQGSITTNVRWSYLPIGIGVSSVYIYWRTPIEYTYQDPAPDSDIDSIDITIEAEGDSRSESLTKGGDGVWRITLEQLDPLHGETKVTYHIHRDGKPDEEKSFSMYIDPAGYVYDIDSGKRIPGASVWLQRPDGRGGWENVPTGEIPAVMQPDTNPYITLVDGGYQWDVLEGFYRVHVEALGYFPADSRVVFIPPPIIDLHIGMKSMGNTPVPEFPSTVLPATMIIGFLGAVLLIQRTREH